MTLLLKTIPGAALPPGERLPDVGEDFASDAHPTCLFAGQDTLRSRHDDGSQPAKDAGDLLGSHVDAETGATDALDPVDHALAPAILQEDPITLLDAGLDDLEVLDEALTLEDLAICS